MAVLGAANVAERMRGKETMAPLVTASGLNRTMVRPIRPWSSIGRADLAAFLVDEAETPRYAHACPRIVR